MCACAIECLFPQSKIDKRNLLYNLKLHEVYAGSSSANCRKPIVDQGVVSLTQAWPHSFVEIDHEILSTVILLLPLIQEGLFCCQLQAKVCAQNTSK